MTPARCLTLAVGGAATLAGLAVLGVAAAASWAAGLAQPERPSGRLVSHYDPHAHRYLAPASDAEIAAAPLFADGAQ